MGWSNGLYRERVPEEHQHTMDITELDLGGIKHNEIESVVEEFVLSEKPPMVIMTGRSEKMKDKVKMILEKYKIDWEIPKHNYGLVKIKN